MSLSPSRRILRGASFVTVATLIVRAGTFASNVVVLRLLGVERVGQLAVIDVWSTIMSTFALFGITSAATKYISQFRVSEPARAETTATSALALVFTISLAVGAAAYIILTARVIPFGATVQQVLRAHAGMLAILLLANSLCDVSTGIVYGYEAFPSLVRVSSIVGFVTFPLVSWLAWMAGVDGVLGARIALGILQLYLLLQAVRAAQGKPFFFPTPARFRQDAARLLRFGAGTFIGHLGQNPVQTLLTSFLASQPGGLVQVGMLSAAVRLCSLSSFLPTTMAPTLIPVLSSEWTRQNTQSFRGALSMAVRTFWLLTLPGIVLFLAACHALLVGLYGPQFGGAWPTAVMMLIVTLLSTCNLALDQTFTAAGRVWLSSSNNLVWTVLFAALGIPLVQSHLAPGYAAAYLISFSLYAVLQLVEVRYIYGLGYGFLRPILLVAASMLALSLVANQLDVSLVVHGVLSIILTAICLVLEWYVCISRGERSQVISLAASLLRRFTHRPLRASP